MKKLSSVGTVFFSVCASLATFPTAFASNVFAPGHSGIRESLLCQTYNSDLGPKVQLQADLTTRHVQADSANSDEGYFIGENNSGTFEFNIENGATENIISSMFSEVIDYKYYSPHDASAWNAKLDLAVLPRYRVTQLEFHQSPIDEFVWATIQDIQTSQEKVISLSCNSSRTVSSPF